MPLPPAPSELGAKLATTRTTASAREDAPRSETLEELRERIRRQIIPFDEVRRRLELVGAPYEPEQIGVSRTRFREAFGKIPYMRSRYTVIDRLFGKGGVWEVGSPAPGSGEPARSAAAPVPGA